jgi:toxin ParE1/3/4
LTALQITPRAARDLAGIARWTMKTWGAARMERYLRALHARMEWLLLHPSAGRIRDDVQPGYRCFAEGQHLIFYITQADGIAIIGVPHQAMDIGGYFT